MTLYRTIFPNLIALFFVCAATGCGADDRPDGSRGVSASPVDGGFGTDARVGEVLSSSGCHRASAYAMGTTVGELNVSGRRRTFRVHVPNGYVATRATPLVLLFHGGGGSGRQFEEASSRMDPIADRERFIAVYPDGTGLVNTWNAGGCCKQAVENGVDDIGFVSSLLDHVESTLCVDRTRIFATGMSNGAMMSHRVGCELSARIAAIAPVAGTDMTTACTPTRPVPILEIHGTADGHVPFAGGMGCGLAGVAFTSVADTQMRWRTRNGCSAAAVPQSTQGDGRCEASTGCRDGAEVVLCRIEGGGHNWPGGDPPAGLVDCPGNGFQSATFNASETIWRFFAAHPMPAR